MKTDASTEQRILAAAEEVFHEKGYSGARMREIAQRAGTNKGLLHYYFKTKDKLFEAIFSVAIRRLISRIQAILELEMPLEEKIGLVVDQYMSLIGRNPALPAFVINELNKNPERFVAKHANTGLKDTFAEFQRTIEKEAEAGNIRPIDARQLLMNILSMIIFPFVGRPMMQVVFASNNREFEKLLAERKQHIKDFVRNALKR